MKARYKDDSEKGPGYGYLIFSEFLPPSGPWSVALQRSYDQNFLAQDGKWIGELSYIPLQGELAEDGTGVALSIDPVIVDALDPQQQYRVSIKGSEGEEPQTTRLHIQDISFSRDERLDNTARKAPTPVEKAAPKPADNIKEKEINPPEPEKPEIQLETPKPQTPPAQKKRWPLVALALLVMAGLLGWVLVSVFSGNEEQTAGPTSVPPPKQEESVEAQVRKFFSQDAPNAATALTLADKLSKTSPADQDAVYRLYYFAVENNDPQAFIPYADCLNPAMPAWGTIHKNAPEAAQFYQKAAQTNPEAAKKALENMLTWLDKQAASGNAEAKNWLEQLKK